MKEKIPLKYDCLDRFQEVVKNCTDDAASKLLVEMFDLIVYQMNEIKTQRIEIVGLKHQEAWKQYNSKKQNKCCIDKCKSKDTMGC